MEEQVAMDSEMAVAGSDSEEESDWEYEYDPNETEDFYVVLDIPTTVKNLNNTDDMFAPIPPKVNAPAKRKPAGRGRGRGRGSRSKAARSAENGESADATSQLENENPDEDQNMDEGPAAPVELAAEVDQADSATPSKFQIMDLESDNPIISYQGNLYSCHWASSIGSDLLFGKRPIEEVADRRQSLYSFDSWDLLAIGSARMVASPATFQRRQAPPISQGQTSIAIYEDENQNRQADFIKRLADIKVKKGEHIGTMVSSIKRPVARGTASASSGPSTTARRGRGGRQPRGARATRISAPSSRQTSVALSQAQNAQLSTPTPASWPAADRSQVQSSEPAITGDTSMEDMQPG